MKTYEMLATAAGKIADRIKTLESAGNGDCFLAALAVRDLLPEYEVTRIVGRLYGQQHEWAMVEVDDEVYHVDPNLWALGGEGILVTLDGLLPDCYEDLAGEEWDDSLAEEFAADLSVLTAA